MGRWLQRLLTKQIVEMELVLSDLRSGEGKTYLNREIVSNIRPVGLIDPSDQTKLSQGRRHQVNH